MIGLKKKMVSSTTFRCHTHTWQSWWNGSAGISNQERQWNDEDRGRFGRKFRKVNYYVTQMIWDHSYYRKYLHRMFKIACSYCFYEERGVIDYTEHTVFVCARCKSYRSLLTTIIRTIMVVKIVGIKTASSENCVNYVERILRLKKRVLEGAEYVGTPA